MSGKALAAGFEQAGKIGDVSVYGQESNPTTWRLAAMNMAIRGIDFNFCKQPANSFTSDAHPDLRADYVMANPSVFVSDKALAVGTSATKPAASALPLTGDPPKGNANFGWLQHMLYHRGIHPKMAQTKQDTHHLPEAQPVPDATPGVASMALLLANGLDEQ